MKKNPGKIIERQRHKSAELKISQEKKLVHNLAFIVGLIGFIIYANTLHHGYAMDDNSLIAENFSTQKGWAAIGEIFKTSYRYGYVFTSADLYRPLSKVMFAIEWWIAPNNPSLNHWINVILYSVTGYFITLTLYQFFKSAALAFVSGLLFMVHPIHTDVVANIKGRDEILALLLSILALYFWRKYLENGKIFQVVLTFIFFFLALFSKESAITFLGVFILVWFFFDSLKTKENFKTFIGLFVLAILFLIIRHNIVGNIVSATYAIEDNFLIGAPDVLHRYTTIIYSMGIYLKLLFLPYPLVFDYSFNQIPIVGLSDFRFIISFIAIAFLAVLTAIRIRCKSIWVFGVLYFFVTFSVASNIFVVIGTSIAERLLYAPSLGFCIVIGFLICKIFKSKENLNSIKVFLLINSPMFVFVLAILIVFSSITIVRNPVWKNDLTLYSHDIKISPNSARLHFYLGNTLMKEENLLDLSAQERESTIKEGIRELRTAITIYPPFTDAWNMMGVAYEEQKNYEEARKCYETALMYNANDAAIYNNIGTLLFDIGNLNEAIKAYRRAIELNPGFSTAYKNLGSSLGRINQYEEAIVALNSAIKLDPSNYSAYHDLGMAYQLSGNNAKAAECFAMEEQLRRSR